MAKSSRVGAHGCVFEPGRFSMADLLRFAGAA
jgi:hypothetical protein